MHLNGRVYDPLIARMTSADPMVPDPMNGQAWNRYSYVINNPLAFTDPSGYCFLGLCGAIDHFFTRLFNEAGRILRQTPILGTIAEIGAVILCGTNPVCGMAAAFLVTTAVAGLESGNLGKGLLAGTIAAMQVFAFYAVGEATNAVAAAAGADTSGLSPGSHVNPAVTPQSYVFNAVAHAAVGCGAAVASGGKCGPSALAAGVTSAAGPVINGFGFYGNLVANAALGGGVAVLGGGKFENGAITSAFGYLFNAEGGSLFRGLGLKPFGLAGIVLEQILSADPAGNANDNGLPTPADATVLYPRGPGVSSGPVPEGYTMVSRWVSPQEAAMWMQNQGTAVPAGVGVDRVYVTLPGAQQPGGTGPIRIDFAIPDSALSPAGNEQWRVIMQPVQSTPTYNVTITVPNGVRIPGR